MCLFKRKTIEKAFEVMVNLALLTGFLWHAFSPAVVSAKNGLEIPIFSHQDREAVLSPLVADRMFYPKTQAVVPDKKILAVITAYSSTVDQCDEDPFIAASGKRVYDGMIAANFLPFGTKIKIPSLYGDKIFTVDDRMNARYGYGRMDIWMDAPRAEVNAFGVKRVEVEVYYVTKVIAKK
jgi:3D (Asp-Asp-Asp) domain-containing protein